MPTRLRLLLKVSPPQPGNYGRGSERISPLVAVHFQHPFDVMSFFHGTRTGYSSCLTMPSLEVLLMFPDRTRCRATGTRRMYGCRRSAPASEPVGHHILGLPLLAGDAGERPAYLLPPSPSGDEVEVSTSFRCPLLTAMPYIGTTP